MIQLFFVPGMFGSTIEYLARSYSNEFTPVYGEILPTGSMHSYGKLAHLSCADDLDNYLELGSDASIVTPIYPFRDRTLTDLLHYFDSFKHGHESRILMYADNVRAAELNMLFQYHKISLGNQRGLDIFCSGNEHNITSWNPDYTHWSQMRPWQLREWISLFYVPWVQEWIDSVKVVGPEFLCIKNTHFLSDPVTAIHEIFEHCGLTAKTGLDQFLKQWQQAQQYVIEEFDLLDDVMHCAIGNRSLTWQPVNIIAEAIVQQRLRAQGYEIGCDGLDTFPTDAVKLHSLLEEVS